MIEILSPVGNKDALISAVNSGANAVYLSGKLFGARKFANNFTNEEIKEAIEYCHIRDVKVYVTVNTVIFNEEIESVLKFVEFLYNSDVDAVIVQDIGILKLIKDNFPNLDIHTSTQMSVQTLSDVLFLENLGVKRVVLARETTIDEIREISNNTNVELEVFVHGALCISQSGQCLISSMIGGRSGNRGSCAQSCRQKYSLLNIDEDKVIKSLIGDYLLSPKDLMTLDDIKKIIDSGVISLKIEGRMKRSEYVKIVTSAYRKAIDNIKDDLDFTKEKERLSYFNREFTKGHIFYSRNSKLMSSKMPSIAGVKIAKVIKYDREHKKVLIELFGDLRQNDELQIRRDGYTIGSRVETMFYNRNRIKEAYKGARVSVNFKHECSEGEIFYKTYDVELMKEINSKKDSNFIVLNGEIYISEGITPSLSIKDSRGNEVNIIGKNIVQKAKNRPVLEGDIRKNLLKLGDTPYYFEKLDIFIDDNIFIPMKEINELRRNAIMKLDELRKLVHDRGKLELNYDKEVKRVEKNKIESVKKLNLTYSVYTLDQFKKLVDLGIKEIIITNVSIIDEAFKYSYNKDINIVPLIYKSTLEKNHKLNKMKFKEFGIKDVVVSNYGHMYHYAKEFNIIVDFNMNIVNSYSFDFYKELNVKRVTLSVENNIDDIHNINKTIDAEIIGYGYIPVMNLKYCPISNVFNTEKNCNLCEKNNYGLKDKKDYVFRLLRREECHMEVLNSNKIFIIDYAKEIINAGITHFRLNFTFETDFEVEEIFLLHKNYLEYGNYGELEYCYNNLISNGITKGHLKRGIK